MSDIFEKTDGLMGGAGSEAGGEWKTINGAHIFIKDGQSVDDAVAAQKANYKNRPESNIHLDKELIRRANSSSHFYEAGDSISKEFNNFIEVVNNSHYNQEEINEISQKAAELFNKELEKKANAPSWMVTGRGNLNQEQYKKKEAAYANAFSDKKAFTNKILREIEDRKQSDIKISRANSITEAVKNAEAAGEREFTFDGTTYYKQRTNWSTKKPTPPKPRDPNAPKKMSALERYLEERRLAMTQDGGVK